MSRFIQWAFIASTEPEIKAGSAEFTVGGNIFAVRLESFSDGLKLADAIRSAYRLGRAEMAQDVAANLHASIDALKARTC